MPGPACLTPQDVAPTAARGSAAHPAGHGTRDALSGPFAGADPAAAAWAALLGATPLDAAELRTLSALARTRLVAAGDRLLGRQQTAQALVALQHGEVALGLRSADGSLQIERIVRGPAWLDLGSAWLAGPHAMDAQAQGPAQLLEWPCAALALRLAHLPGLAQRLIVQLAAEVQVLAGNTHELMHKDAPARLAQWLHLRCEPLAGQAGQALVQAQVLLRDRKRNLAAQLAITPETLSRLMRSLSRQGVIEVAGYRVKVLDPAALARLAQG